MRNGTRVAGANHSADTNLVGLEDLLSYFLATLAVRFAAASPPLACVIESKKSLCFWNRPLLSVAKQIQVAEQLQIISAEITEGTGWGKCWFFN